MIFEHVIDSMLSISNRSKISATKSAYVETIITTILQPDVELLSEEIPRVVSIIFL